MNLQFDLRKKIKGTIAEDDKTLEEYSVDASIFKVRPEAVIFPKDSGDVKMVVNYVNEKRKKGDTISITARSAGTDMSGGPLGQSIILSFTKYFNRLVSFSNPSNSAGDTSSISVTVEPGLYYRDLEKVLDQKNLLYPPYPASKDYCAMGGIVANNSGGEKTLAYGKTEDYVLSLKAVLANGQEYQLEPLPIDRLKEKMAGSSFEAQLYSKLFNLLENNYGLIQAAKPQVSKNSAGYALWNVWDKKTFNLAKLLTGAQGTLGIITQSTLKLVPKKKHSRLVVIFAKSLDPIPELVEAILPFKPESIESYDDKTLSLAMKFLPALIKMMKGNVVSLGLHFLPELMMIMRGGFPKMVLLVELTSDDENELYQKMEQVRQAANKFPVQVRLIKNKKEEQKYWTIRRHSFALLHSRVKGRYAAAFVDDIIVKPEFMPQFLPKVNAILEPYKDKLIYTIAGHPGNGNFHIIPLIDLKDLDMPKIITDVTKQIYDLVGQFHGSITGEHNDGLIRTSYLGTMYSKEILALFAEVKKIFDPQNIFNPGKKVDGDWHFALEHLRKE